MAWGRPVGRRWGYGPGQHGKPENRPLYDPLGRLTWGFIRIPDRFLGILRGICNI